MKIAILANATQRQEWESRNDAANADIQWVEQFDGLLEASADWYIDLLFPEDISRIGRLAGLGKPVIINSVIHPLYELSYPSNSFGHKVPLLRINAWPTFLNRTIAEAAFADEGNNNDVVRRFFDAIGWKLELVPDVPGLISARVIAMIINEAFFTLEAGVASKEDIDIAMKLGTNYPVGPFEWAERIGVINIYELLLKLSESDKVYVPCELMRNIDL